ncbi:MAG: hypothetical protein K8R53_13930 [Bacteroidales bacterium]|nr:hypothetical protein [Bacteroidales bacterium]
MKRKYNFFGIIVGMMLIFSISVIAEEVKYPDSWGTTGLTLNQSKSTSVSLSFSVTNFFIEDQEINGEGMKVILLPDVLLPNNEGAPNLPGYSRMIAIPQGAEVKLNLLSARTETMQGMNIAPAPRIPLDTETGPLFYQKDEKIYGKDDFYPVQPVIMSEITQLRGVDVVTIGITPFQYKPVTKEFIIYRDIDFEIEFVGGNGQFGEDRLRSRWFDPIIKDAVLNYESLPEIDYDKPKDPSETLDYEYIIIVPNDNVFIEKAEEIKQWRTLQGIRTGVVTTQDIGGNNTTQIENYINNAYNTWAIPPVAVLLLADYGTSGSRITSPIYSNYCVSDNIFADINSDHLPDMIFARMTAQNITHLNTMIAKVLDYEQNPPTNPNFYDHPITALGWQTTRWFQICSETVGGFF